MKAKAHFILIVGSTLLIAALIGACASKSYINLTYNLPVATDDLKGKRVFLDCKDQRTDKKMFGPKAQAEFKHFTGLFSLSVDQGKKPFVAGAFDLTSLFNEAFNRRLKNLGTEVIPTKEKATPVIEINIKKFHLDLVDRKWVTSIRYEARLLKDSRLMATENISADAERVKVIGSGDAEKILGEIFTDSVNRLNLRKLLDQAAS
jgi:hypothetical protein